MTKLRPPTVRKQWVARERLLERLRPEPGVRLTALVAPPGSGKTTLLGTWLEIEAPRRPVGWVSLDEGDNDPVLLWSHVLGSLRRVCPALAHSVTPERVGAAGVADSFLPDLVNGLSEQDDAALVLDDFHRLSGASRDSVAWLVEHTPPSFQLVISTRTEPGLPVAKLRARGELLEVRAAELGFSGAEADVFLNERLQLGLERDEVEQLVERTEGWPAGLYLAALSLRGVDDRHAFVDRFGGESRGVVDFLVDEVLEAHDPEMQSLMLRCSVLERLCGPLCDALLDEHGSARRLRELARTNLFLLPLDDHGQWYRFHHLFAQLLRVELEHREPGLAPALHRRAHAWHRDHGSSDEAIEHALGAGAFAEVGELIAARWLEYVNDRRAATVLGWLERIPPELVDADASLLHVKAWLLSLSARGDEAAETIAAVERLERDDATPLPDGGTSIEAGLATLRATLSEDVGARYENALRAVELEQPRSPYWPAACRSLGTAHFFRGEFAQAEPWYVEAARSAETHGQWSVVGSALAYRSFVAGEQGDLAQQRLLAGRAAELVRDRGAEAVDGDVWSARGTSLAASGQLVDACLPLERGVDVQRSSGQPIELAHALVRQARALRALGDQRAAAAVIAEARATVDLCPDPGVLERWVAELERPPREGSARGDGGLSTRELTVLRALTGPLSERDIARELYLSHNTVHSHTRSVYRKLGVSSRAEAIRRARERGLL